MHALSRIKLSEWLIRPFVFFSILLLFKMYVAQFVIFDGESLWSPLIAGLPAAWLLFSLVELLLPKRKLGAYLTVNVIVTSIYFAVIMYYKYFGVIVTYYALKQVGQVTEVRGSVFSLLHPYFLFIFTDIVVILGLMLFNRRFRAWGKSLAVAYPKRKVSYMLVGLLLVCTINIALHDNSVNELKQAEKMGILNFQAYIAIKSTTQKMVDPSHVTIEAIRKLKGISAYPANPTYWGTAKGKNVIVIQLEAAQNFLLGLHVDGQEITPVMNKLMAETLYFPHFYQQVGQGNTSDAEFVVNTSQYIPPFGAASQEYAHLDVPSMPKLLKRHGYQSATFHTNDVAFWNRKELYAALGFDTYYDATFYGDEDVVFFGASDEVLYHKTAEQLLQMSASGNPFYAQVISMSAHHPFNIEEHKVSLGLSERYEGTLVGHYLQAQNYADYALGMFVDELKQNGLWDQSIIVIYGDHLGLPLYSLTQVEKELMAEIYGREYGVAEMLNIPLLISVPGQTPGQVLYQTGGHADLMPTIANLLGVSMRGRIYFGQDLINVRQNLLPQRYYLPTGSFVNDRGVFVPGDQFADGEFLPFEGGEPAAGAVTEDEFNRALELLRLSDAYMSGLPKR